MIQVLFLIFQNIYRKNELILCGNFMKKKFQDLKNARRGVYYPNYLTVKDIIAEKHFVKSGGFFMSLNRLFFASGLLSAMLLFSGCVVVREYAPPKEAVKVTVPEQELARKLLQAFIKNDAKGFVALLPEETRSKFTVKDFAKTRKAVVESIGEPVAYSYLTTLKMESLHPQIWKVTFRRNNANRTRDDRGWGTDPWPP